MSYYSAEEIRRIVASRAPFDKTITVALEVESTVEFIEIILMFRFWPQYRTYIAYPVTFSMPGGALIALSMPDAWLRYLKRELRNTFGVRHIHNVNNKDNSKRIEKLLGLQRL